jgi:hypothetical protein
MLVIASHGLGDPLGIVGTMPPLPARWSVYEWANNINWGLPRQPSSRCRMLFRVLRRDVLEWIWQNHAACGWLGSGRLVFVWG